MVIKRRLGRIRFEHLVERFYNTFLMIILLHQFYHSYFLFFGIHV